MKRHASRKGAAHGAAWWRRAIQRYTDSLPGLPSSRPAKALPTCFRIRAIANTRARLARSGSTSTPGLDATVAVANVGANGSIDTEPMRQPVVDFVLANTGLEVGAYLQGMKVTELSM